MVENKLRVLHDYFNAPFYLEDQSLPLTKLFKLKVIARGGKKGKNLIRRQIG
jgi:hypothetical protein